jgi:hypothetical protein
MYTHTYIHIYKHHNIHRGTCFEYRSFTGPRSSDGSSVDKYQYIYKYRYICIHTHIYTYIHIIIYTGAHVLNTDHSLGLAHQMVAALTNLNIKKLTSTYITLSLKDIASSTGLANIKDTEKLLLKMVSQGEIKARINQQSGRIYLYMYGHMFIYTTYVYIFYLMMMIVI